MPNERFQVVSQNFRSSLAPGGVLREVVDISFETRSGTVASISVDEADYMPDFIEARILSLVDRIEAVEAL